MPKNGGMFERSSFCVSKVVCSRSGQPLPFESEFLQFYFHVYGSGTLQVGEEARDFRGDPCAGLLFEDDDGDDAAFADLETFSNMLTLHGRLQ